MSRDTIAKEVGYSCSYVPLEILDSFGIKTTYVIRDPSSPNKSQGYVNQNMCGFCRDICSRPRGQVYDMVFTNCCDAMTKLYESFRIHPDFKNDFSFLLHVPRSYEAMDVAYWPNVLSHFIQTLETATGESFSENRLRESIIRFNRLRSSLRQVERMLLEDTIWGSEYVKLLFALYDAGVDKSIMLTEEFITARREDEEKDADFSILVTGSNMPVSLQLAKHVEECDGNVRFFDACNLARFYNMEVSESAPPLEALSEAYLTRLPCARMKNSTPRMANLIQLIKQYGMDLAVYHTVKFCAPHVYDFIEFKELCNENSIPLVRIETDHEYELPGQMATRLEAALEML